MLTSPSPPHGSLSEVKRWIALFVHLIEVEQGSRQDRRPGLTGMEGLVEAGVGVIGVVPIWCQLGRLCGWWLQHYRVTPSLWNRNIFSSCIIWTALPASCSRKVCLGNATKFLHISVIRGTINNSNVFVSSHRLLYCPISLTVVV